MVGRNRVAVVSGIPEAEQPARIQSWYFHQVSAPDGACATMTGAVANRTVAIPTSMIRSIANPAIPMMRRATLIELPTF